MIEFFQFQKGQDGLIREAGAWVPDPHKLHIGVYFKLGHYSGTYLHNGILLGAKEDDLGSSRYTGLFCQHTFCPS